MELRIDEATDTYRVVCVARFSGAVFVLDAFEKKSPTGAVGFRRTSSRGFDSGTSINQEDERAAIATTL